MTTAVEYDPEAPMTESEADAVLNGGEKERAPWGYTKDGKPRKGPGGRPPKQGSTAPKPPKTSATRPSGKTSSKPRSGKAPDYTQGLIGLTSIIALPLKFVSPLDSVAVMVHAEDVASAINETAKDRAEVAALCDKLLSVGPYGLIIGAILPLGAQIAVNHDLIPVELGAKLGAMPRDQLMEAAAVKAAEAEETMRQHAEAAAA